MAMDPIILLKERLADSNNKIKEAKNLVDELKAHLDELSRTRQENTPLFKQVKVNYDKAVRVWAFFNSEAGSIKAQIEVEQKMPR